jgi:hypothetical protein
MERIVWNEDIYTMVYAPPDFNTRSQLALDALPDEWHAVIASPCVIEFEDGSGSKYIGATFTFFDGVREGARMAACVIGRPEDLLEPDLREACLRRIRHAFEHPEEHPKMPETTWRIGS